MLWGGLVLSEGSEASAETNPRGHHSGGLHRRLLRSVFPPSRFTPPPRSDHHPPDSAALSLACIQPCPVRLRGPAPPTRPSQPPGSRLTTSPTRQKNPRGLAGQPKPLPNTHTSPRSQHAQPANHQPPETSPTTPASTTPRPCKHRETQREAGGSHGFMYIGRRRAGDHARDKAGAGGTHSAPQPAQSRHIQTNANARRDSANAAAAAHECGHTDNWCVKLTFNEACEEAHRCRASREITVGQSPESGRGGDQKEPVLMVRDVGQTPTSV